MIRLSAKTKSSYNVRHLSPARGSEVSSLEQKSTLTLSSRAELGHRRTRSIEKLYGDAVRRIHKSERVENEKAREAFRAAEYSSRITSLRRASSLVHCEPMRREGEVSVEEIANVEISIQRIVAKHGLNEVLTVLSSLVNNKGPDAGDARSSQDTSPASCCKKPRERRTADVKRKKRSNSKKPRKPARVLEEAEAEMRERELRFREKLLRFAASCKKTLVFKERSTELEENEDELPTVAQRTGSPSKGQGLQKYLVGGARLLDKPVAMSKPGPCKGD